MEMVFRKETYDVYIKANSDDSVSVTLQTKNGTGTYTQKISSEEFELFCKMREMQKKDIKK